MDNEHGGGEKDKHQILNSEVSSKEEVSSLAKQESPRTSSSSDSSLESNIDPEKNPHNDPVSMFPQSPKESPEAPKPPQDPRLSQDVSGHSPAAQNHVMGYDPNRIPASVFATKPGTASQVEWSVASTESLFSIHMGNNSFSKDHVLNLYKSGELPWMDETGNLKPVLESIPQMVKESDETKVVPVFGQQKPHMDTIAEPGIELGDNDTNGGEKEDSVMEQVLHEPEKENPQDNIPDEVRISSTSSSNSSDHSFHFPLLNVEQGRLSSVKQVVMEKQESIKKQQSEKHQLEEQQQHQKIKKLETTSKFINFKNLLSCFSCCPFLRRN